MEKSYELCAQKGIGLNVMKVYGGGDLLSEQNYLFGVAIIEQMQKAANRFGY